jgi:hypothetical protein
MAIRRGMVEDLVAGAHDLYAQAEELLLGIIAGSCAGVRPV